MGGLNTKEQTAIFPDKDFNIEFLESIAFSESLIKISSRKDLDEAARELNFINQKRKDFRKKADKLCGDIISRQSSAEDKMKDYADRIYSKITSYCKAENVELEFTPTDNGKEQAVLQLEHGEIKIIRTITEKVTFTPKSEEAKAA